MKAYLGTKTKLSTAAQEVTAPKRPGRKATLTPEQRRANKREYNREYSRNRYATDPEYRARLLVSSANNSAARRAKFKAQGLGSLGQKIQSRTGKLYIAECQGFYKIGFSNDMYDREVKLNVNNPFPVTMVYISDTIEGVNFVESALHDRYQSKRVKGEWFTLNKTNVKHIKTAVNKVSKAHMGFTV